MTELFAGRYELTELIGEGGMGSVWRVWDAKERVFRAGKVLRASDATSLLRFVRELGYRIRHPHVLAPIGWVGEDDRVMFTMDLVRGGSVASLLGDYGGLPPEWAALLLDQLLGGLGAVHAAGLVHRDVKPANLLLHPTGSGRPHLLLSDFGIAAPVDGPRFTSVSVVLGTLGYLAPEQLRGAVPDPRQDLYAAGAVAVEMLTGSLAALPAEQRPPRGVPSRLWDVVRRLVAVEPAQRWPSAAAAREALAATGFLPGTDSVPDDQGRDIEVLEHVTAMAAPAPAQGPGNETSATAPATVRQASADDTPTTAVAAATARTSFEPSTRTLASANDAAPTHALPAPHATTAGRPRAGNGPAQRVAIAAAASSVLAGIGLLALGLRSPDTAPHTPTVPPASGSGTVTVKNGDVCSWADQLTAAQTRQQVPMTCNPGKDGSYTWTPTSR